MCGAANSEIERLSSKFQGLSSQNLAYIVGSKLEFEYLKRSCVVCKKYEINNPSLLYQVYSKAFKL